MAQGGTHRDSSARKGGWLDWIERHPKTVGAVCVLVVLTGVWFGLEAAGSARLRRAMAAVRAKGEPLTVADLRKRIPIVPDERNMAIGLLKHGGAVHRYTDTAEFRERSGNLPMLGNAKSVQPGVRYSDEQLAAVREFLRVQAAEIAAIEEATQLADGVYPITWTSPATFIQLPQLSVHRTACKSLGLKALMAAHEGRGADAVSALRAMSAMDAALRHEPFLISQLVRIACQSLSCDTLLRCLALTPLTDTQLENLDVSLVRFSAPPGLHEAMLAERVFSLDSISWAYQGGNLGGITSGTAPPGVLLRLSPALKGVDPAIYLEQMVRLCEATELPPVEAVAKAGQVEQAAKSLPFYAVTTKILMPSLSRTIALWVRSDVIVRATRVALACERYRLRHGDWPTGLAKLVPEFLPAEAIADPCSRKPFGYHRDKDGIRVYSVGEDGIDDGGVMDREQSTSQRTVFDPGVFLPNADRRNLATATQPASR